MTLLIAEISNHHQGDMKKAKELIFMAKECGADAVKGQAFIAQDMMKSGTMDIGFYRQCSFTYQQYKELIEFGNAINIPMFFTILSPNFANLNKFQKYKKIHALGFARRNIKRIVDHENLLISSCGWKDGMENFKKAKLMYASVYMKDHKRNIYDFMVENIGRPLGLSHHGQGVNGLIEFINNYHIPVIEKHFYLGKRITYKGQVYRDCLHSANPIMFEHLASKYKNRSFNSAMCNM